MQRPAARWPVVLYCLLSWAAAFYHLILFSFLKRDVRGALALSDGAIGWIDGLTFASTAVGGLLLGRAADRGARRLAVALAPALPALGSWMLASAEGAPAVIAARLAIGFGVGGGWGVGHAAIARIYEGRGLLRAAAILQTGGPLGAIGAALAGAVFVPDAPDGWRTVLAWSALTAAIAALDPWAMRSGRWAGSAPPRPAAKAGAPAEAAARIPAAAYRIFALLALQMTAYWCTFGWLPMHLAGHGATRHEIGWIQVATGTTQAFADLAFGWLSPKVGVRRLFAACNFAFGAGVIALAAAYDVVAANPLALAATICAIGLGSGSWAAFGPLYAVNVPHSIRATVASVSYHLARATQFVVQPLVASLGTAESPQSVALLVAALAAWAGAAAIHRIGPVRAPAER